MLARTRWILIGLREEGGDELALSFSPPAFDFILLNSLSLFFSIYFTSFLSNPS